MADSSADQWSAEETNTAILLGGAFVFAIDAWKTEHDDALNKWDDINRRWLDMMEELAECYCNVTFPQQVKAIEAACGFGVPEPSCSETGTWRACASEIVDRYAEAEACYREDYCLSDEALCDRGWTLQREAMAANATQQKWASDLRRRDRMLEQRIQVLNAAKAAAWVDSSPISGLAGNAASKVSSLASGAAAGFNATAQAFGFAIGTVGNLFGNN